MTLEIVKVEMLAVAERKRDAAGNYILTQGMLESIIDLCHTAGLHEGVKLSAEIDRRVDRKYEAQPIET